MKRHGFLLRATTAVLALAAPAAALAQASPSAFTTGYRYDANGRLTGTISPEPRPANPLGYPAVRNSYDPNGWLTLVEKGVLSSWQSDAVAPSAWSGFSVETATAYGYDEVGRVASEAVTAGGTTYQLKRTSYDEMGRVRCEAVRMSVPSTAGPIDACVQTSGATVRDRIQKTDYWTSNQPKEVRRAVGAPIEQVYAAYEYDANQNMTALTDANGNRAEMSYDGHDRRSYWFLPSKTVPGQASATDYERYLYDAASNRTWWRKRDGQTLDFQYDALNRRSLKTPSAGVPTYYVYDLRNLQTYAALTNSSEYVAMGYDGPGRLTSSTSMVAGVGLTLGYQYDGNNNRTRITHPDNSYFQYDYDGVDRIEAVRENGGAVVAGVGYNGYGERVSLTGGMTTGYTYDPIGRLGSITHNLAGGQGVTFSNTAYNAANQVTAASVSNDAYASATYNASRNYVKNGLNQYDSVGSAAYAYDANGNLTSDGRYTYTYDIENRLTAIGGATTVSLAYDPLGRLRRTVGGGGDVRYLYDGDALVAEYDNASNLLRRYVHGPGPDEPWLLYEGGQRRQLRADQRGSIVSISDLGGNPVWANRYDAFGVPFATNQGRFQYTGQIKLSEVDFYHYKARVYAPRLGRFLQVDPVGYDDQVNLYAYVGNDPVNSDDPTGLAESNTCSRAGGTACSGIYVGDGIRGAGNVLAGALDFATLGASTAILKKTSIAPDESSNAFVGGQVGGAAVTLLSGVGAFETGLGAWRALRAESSLARIGLRSQLGAEEIARGHAWLKHGVEFKDLGIRTQRQFQQHVERVLSNPSEVRVFKDGRSLYTDNRSGTVVWRSSSSEGTAFRPKSYLEYIRQNGLGK